MEAHSKINGCIKMVGIKDVKEGMMLFGQFLTAKEKKIMVDVALNFMSVDEREKYKPMLKEFAHINFNAENWNMLGNTIKGELKKLMDGFDVTQIPFHIGPGGIEEIKRLENIKVIDRESLYKLIERIREDMSKNDRE